jgi:hypothetical protein
MGCNRSESREVAPRTRACRNGQWRLRWPAHPILGKMMGRLIDLAGPLFARPLDRKAAGL